MNYFYFIILSFLTHLVSAVPSWKWGDPLISKEKKTKEQKLEIACFFAPAVCASISLVFMYYLLGKSCS